MQSLPITLSHLRLQLSEMNFNGDDAISQIEKAIKLIRKAISNAESKLNRCVFKNHEEEIHYYKHIKPPLYSLQIAYCKMLKIELIRPTLCKKDFKILLRNKLDFIQAHYTDYPEFTRYYNSNQTYNDNRYFLKANRIDLDYFPYFCDEGNSTGYDVVASYLLAYQYLIKHYDQTEKKTQIDGFSSNITWTADKVAFVELVSGLHIMSSINGGDVELKTLCITLGHALNIDIKDLYGKRKEIKYRKGERFKYIRQMLDALERDFDENKD